VFYGEDGQCYLRHVGQVAVVTANPHRPLTPAEMQRRARLTAYLDRLSEDQLIEEALSPCSDNWGFTESPPLDTVNKALEYGKDVWMRYTLPTQHGTDPSSEATQRRRSDVAYPRSRPDAAVLA
jgi:hypothetical protein